MPIGKNAIKRITNDGYSKVKTSAPDMENSTAVEASTVAQEKTPKTKKATSNASAKAKAPTKTSPKKPSTQKSTSTPKKSMENEPELAPVKTLEKVVDKSIEASEREGNGYTNIGGKLPYYLL